MLAVMTCVIALYTTSPNSVMGNFTSHGFKNCSVFFQPSIITVEVTHFTGVIPHSRIYSFAFPKGINLLNAHLFSKAVAIKGETVSTFSTPHPSPILRINYLQHPYPLYPMANVGHLSTISIFPERRTENP